MREGRGLKQNVGVSGDKRGSVLMGRGWPAASLTRPGTKPARRGLVRLAVCAYLSGRVGGSFVDVRGRGASFPFRGRVPPGAALASPLPHMEGGRFRRRGPPNRPAHDHGRAGRVSTPAATRMLAHALLPLVETGRE